jgi:phage tail tape-measure protein
MGLGILIFATAGAVIGAMVGDESITVSLYVGGFLVGAFAGTNVGRWVEAQKTAGADSTNEDTPAK